MKRNAFAWGAVIAVVLCLQIGQPGDATIAARQNDDEWRALYDNPEIYESLSGSARSMLEARYGASSTHVSAALAPSSTSSAHSHSALSNPLVNDPAQDTTPGSRFTQSETTIVLGSGTTVIAGFNDSGSLSNPVVASSKFTGFSRSTDMGATWTDGGTLSTNPNGDAGDPVLARNDALGRTYFSTLNFSGAGLRVFSSNDDGLTWNAPVNGAPGAVGFQDKEWLTVDNFPGTCHGNVYLAFRDFGPAPAGIRFTRSTDDGATFGPSPGLLLASQGTPGNVQGAYVTVGLDHAVYAFWLDQSAGPGTPNIIKMRKSSDCGLTFAPSVNVATLLTTLVNGSLGAVGGFRTNSFVQAVVNPSDANEIYLVHNDNPAGADSGDVFLRQSTDGGATWGAAVKLNTDATTNLQWFPAIAVKPDGSGLAVSWYDRRRDPADSLIEYWGVIGTIAGSTVTFGPNFRISNRFPAVFGTDPVVNPVYMGDYDQMVADQSFFYVTWGDNRLPSAPDVRFAKIPVAGPGPILDFVSTTIGGGDGDGIIERDECTNLTVTIVNDGTATATGIVGELSTTTPGVTITQPFSDYPNLAPGAMASNVTPFRISTSAGFVCGTPIELTLTLNYAEGADTIPITLSTCLCPPVTVNGSIGAGDATSTGRPFRDDPPSSCAVSPPCAVFNAAGAYRYATHTFTNGDAAACVTVTVTTACTGANFIQAAAYLGSFNPGSVCLNFLGDIGASVAVSKSFSFNLPANATFDAVIHESFVSGGCASYTATVSGLICGSSSNGACTLGCVRPQGYWKNNSSAWPVSSLTLGTVTYTQAQLLSILSQPVAGNGLVSLAHQLIAARLNLASGAAATPTVTQAIVDANALIDGLLIPPVGGGSLSPSATSALTTALEGFNKALAPGGPPLCE
jgi:hypothetical protein